MTKQEELKNLDAIEKLILKAGEDSYTAQALKGCVAIARDNVVNDFWNSPVEAAHTMRSKLNDMEANLEAAKENWLDECRTSDELRQKISGMENERKKFSLAYNDVMDRMNTAENENEKLKAEVVKLKARLYDLLCKD